MARVMIKCPETDEPVFTGFEMDQEGFEVAKPRVSDTLGCDACGHIHDWKMEDAVPVDFVYRCPDCREAS